MSFKKLIPAQLKSILKPWIIPFQFLKVSAYDVYRFLRYSGIHWRTSKSEVSLGAQITKCYHIIEKGLALPEPRPGFGKEAIKNLCAQLEYAINNNICANEVTLAMDALHGYADFNAGSGIKASEHINRVLDLAERKGFNITGKPVKEPERLSDVGTDYIKFITSRVSVRNFSNESVPEVVLENAVKAAQHAPCVCNRQAGRIYLLRGEEEKHRALALQNGNRGFGSEASVIAIIAMDISEMLEPTERYQHWIDGGMFAQNFLLGIHAQGYGACPLNWSSSIGNDLKLRKLGYVKPEEVVIMMVAVGRLKGEYKVARSERKLLDNISHTINK
ncbi:nitroreductase family protein [Methylobacillus sp. Pita1]|uniref:nitroreductase family protein n=1 Tax=Methylobacillus sp. Pita1 TaxID=3382642 RepID=UPI0038B52934